MSEELLQTVPHRLDRYEYYKLGASTLAQLRQAQILPLKQVPAKIASKKPDGLIRLPNGAIKAVIEYKSPSELATPEQIAKAIEQEIEVARLLCKLLVVTDGQKSVWINALTGNLIRDEHGAELQTFSAKRILEGKLSREEIEKLEELLDTIEDSLTESNDTLVAPELIDPSQLARTIWQKIWINTGKQPEQCLYNVVELFVFKFLSDVGVLADHLNFDSVHTLKNKASAQEALKHYADRCRKEIKDLFPAGTDGTTIINGTIFVNERDEPNLAQARLFGEVLDHLQDFSKQHGSFKHIQREFKTRLYESFLRQEAGIRLLGQYFTPRNVVRAMVEMSSARELQPGSRICDPFCGVGGFILETIASNPRIYATFEPRNGKVDSTYTLIGYDKGTDEQEDARTIILAKANMLIYFSDLLAKYPSREYLRAFSAGAFNRVFRRIRSNLGTFAEVNGEPFDLILTNPPYVTSGSNSLKRAIEDENLAAYYTSGGRGTESLALEWIIRNLKPGGEGLVVVPDGLLKQVSVLNWVTRYCTVRAVISLPTRTFYSTPKKTYILVLKRKFREQELQADPVFTYLVSEIGETRDANRFKTRNDLNEAVDLYNQFKGSPGSFVSQSKRCQIVPFEEFQAYPHWMVDRRWDPGIKLELGITEEETEVSEEEFYEMLRGVQSLLKEALDA